MAPDTRERRPPGQEKAADQDVRKASVYGLHIFPQHAELLVASAVSPEVARERGYVSAGEKTRLESAGFAKSQRVVPSLLIPIYGTDGELRTHQNRPDNPRLDNGKPRKYETPWRHAICLDVPRRVNGQLTDPAVPLWITEGARKADAAVTAGLCCIALIGVDGWQSKGIALPDWKLVRLKDREVLIAYDSDVMSKASVGKALRGITTFLSFMGATVRHVILPEGEDGAKVGLDDYLATHTVAELAALARDPAGPPKPSAPPSPPPPEPAPSTLGETVAVFKRWLYLDDPAPLYALAAALAANRAPGDPVWLLLVCAPSTGKTELLSAAVRLPWVIPAAKVTEAALLSGTSARERARDATGGLLRRVGDFGVLLCKDLTSVLAQNRDTRNEALAALREIYDGSWDRPVGTDGGRTLHWHGKCGLIGGVTPALDQYGQVVSHLGDRWVLLRMPDPKVGESGHAALRNAEHETRMRRELAEALAGLVTHAGISKVNRPLTGQERARLITLAAYTARARTPVARDGYHQEVQYLPQAEGPGRVVKVYARLLGGLEAIGCDQPTAWKVLARIATDCAPAARTTLIRELLSNTSLTGPVAVRTSDIATKVGMVTKTASRYLEDLSLLGIADHSKRSEASNAADMWRASQWLCDHWPQSETEMYLPSPNPPKGEGEASPNSSAPDDAERVATGPPVHLSPAAETGRRPGESSLGYAQRLRRERAEEARP